MHASMVHVWEYLTRCGHKFLWLKINPLPPGYTGSVSGNTATSCVSGPLRAGGAESDPELPFFGSEREK